MRTAASILSLAMLGLGFSHNSRASESADWVFEATPYIQAAGMNGDAGMLGVTAEVDMSFGDILEHFDQGFTGLFTARKGPWLFGLETVYFKLEEEGAKSVSGPFGQVNLNGELSVSSSMYVYQGTVGYRVLDGKTKLDLLGALRYTKMDNELKIRAVTTPGIVFPGGGNGVSVSESWSDAVAGVIVHHAFTDEWSLFGMADVGAGGSDLTYQYLVGANWEYSEGFTAKLGYRYLYWDYEEDGFVWDMASSGPYLGLGIRF